MGQMKQLLTEELQMLMDTEKKLVEALPKMARAAHNPKLREGLEKHLEQTKGHVQRLEEAFRILGAKAEAKPDKGMQGLIAEGEQIVEEGRRKEEIPADLALIACAQKVEHYEISGYGTARTIASQLGETRVVTLLSHTLGEEEGADHLLTEISKPLVQEASAAEMAPVGAR